MNRFLTPTGTRATAQRVGLALVAMAALATAYAAPAGAAPLQTAPSAAQAQTTSDAATALDTVLQPVLPSDCSTLTLTETEGPYFKAGSPDATVLAADGTAGTRLLLSGYVVDTNCQPVAGALVDFWQANDAGQYDNSGYTLRGHQYTDANGFYQVETIVPGLYTGRTRHIHVKVQAPGQSALTTQLYFPDDPNNARDGIFRENGSALLMQVQPAADGSLDAAYTFIVNAQ